MERCGSRVNFYSRTQFEIILKKNGQLAWVPDSTDVHPIKELSILCLWFICFAWMGFYPSMLHGEDHPVISDTYARFNRMAREFQLPFCMVSSILLTFFLPEESG